MQSPAEDVLSPFQFLLRSIVWDMNNTSGNLNQIYLNTDVGRIPLSAPNIYDIMTKSRVRGPFRVQYVNPVTGRLEISTYPGGLNLLQILSEVNDYYKQKIGAKYVSGLRSSAPGTELHLLIQNGITPTLGNVSAYKGYGHFGSFVWDPTTGVYSIAFYP